MSFRVANLGRLDLLRHTSNGNVYAFLDFYLQHDTNKRTDPANPHSVAFGYLRRVVQESNVRALAAVRGVQDLLADVAAQVNAGIAPSEEELLAAMSAIELPLTDPAHPTTASAAPPDTPAFSAAAAAAAAAAAPLSLFPCTLRDMAAATRARHRPIRVEIALEDDDVTSTHAAPHAQGVRARTRACPAVVHSSPAVTMAAVVGVALLCGVLFALGMRSHARRVMDAALHAYGVLGGEERVDA